jgi:hypothetical protein
MANPTCMMNTKEPARTKSQWLTLALSSRRCCSSVSAMHAASAPWYVCCWIWSDDADSAPVRLPPVMATSGSCPTAAVASSRQYA